MADSLEVKRSWVTLLYLYVATLIGLIIVIVGVLIALHALLDVIFYEDPLAAVTNDTTGDTVEFAELGGPFSPSRGDKAKLILGGAGDRGRGRARLLVAPARGSSFGDLQSLGAPWGVQIF